jgi:hypothetical protein
MAFVSHEDNVLVVCVMMTSALHRTGTERWGRGIYSPTHASTGDFLFLPLGLDAELAILHLFNT